MQSDYRKIAALIVIAAAARAVSLAWLHPVTWDEIEFYRATQWVANGLVPFRDFWEHHTPLQWFVFAPLAAFVNTPGVAAIIAMRWAQVPLWIGTFAALFFLMRDRSVSARLGAILLAICSSMFMLAAVEYRIDSLGCALYIIALLLLQQNRPFWAGVCLCLAGFANIRLGPLIAVTMVVAVLDRRQLGGRSAGNLPAGSRRTGRLAAGGPMIAGAAIAFMICASYFVVTQSAVIAFRSVWTDNYLADKLAHGPRWMFLHRLAVPFGIRPLESVGPLFSPGAIDVATIAIILLGLPAFIRGIRRGEGLAILQIANIAFIAIMKFIHHYHFEIAILLMLPYVAEQLERIHWRAAMAVLLLASAVNIYASVFRGKEDDMRYEDFIMRQVDARTTNTVFDGVGRALRRRPAYRYWFLPALQNVLEAAGRFEPYRPRELPDAIIADYRVYGYLRTHPQLARTFTSHYLPLWRNLWIPAFTSRGTGEWIAPVDGTYVVIKSQALASHAWFRHPLEIGVFDTNVPPLDLRGADRSVTLTVSRGQRLHVDAPANIAVFIVPADEPVWFRQPPHGVTLDGVAPAVTHIPHF
jgi:hypothetical protein